MNPNDCEDEDGPLPERHSIKRVIYEPRRRPCWLCSRQLQLVPGRGYHASIIEVDGIEREVHRQCAEGLNTDLDETPVRRAVML